MVFNNNVGKKALVMVLLLNFITFSLQAPVPMNFLRNKLSKNKGTTSRAPPEHSQELDPHSHNEQPSVSSSSEDTFNFDLDSGPRFIMTEEQQLAHLATFDHENLDPLQYEIAIRPMREHLANRDTESTKLFHKLVKSHLHSIGKSSDYIKQVLGYAKVYAHLHYAKHAKQRRKEMGTYSPIPYPRKTRKEQELNNIVKKDKYSQYMAEHEIAPQPTAQALEVETRVLIAGHPDNKQLTRELFSYLEQANYDKHDVKVAKKNRSVYNTEQRLSRAAKAALERKRAQRALNEGQKEVSRGSESGGEEQTEMYHQPYGHHDGQSSQHHQQSHYDPYHGAAHQNYDYGNSQSHNYNNNQNYDYGNQQNYNYGNHQSHIQSGNEHHQYPDQSSSHQTYQDPQWQYQQQYQHQQVGSPSALDMVHNMDQTQDDWWKNDLP